MDNARRSTENIGPKRRVLRFDDLKEVLGDIQRLRAREHAALGRWTLAQICKHLADSINGSIDGLDLSRHRFKRWFLAGRMLAWTFENGIPTGITVDPKLTPPSGLEIAPAYAALEEAIRRYQAYRGRLEPHPLFGRMSRVKWDRLHCIHCAHHLSFITDIP